MTENGFPMFMILFLYDFIICLIVKMLFFIINEKPQQAQMGKMRYKIRFNLFLFRLAMSLLTLSHVDFLMRTTSRNRDNAKLVNHAMKSSERF